MINLRALIAALSFATLLAPSAYAATSYKSFNIANTGNAPLNISDVAISGNVSEYQVWDGCSSPVPIGGTCTLYTAFNPLGGGERPPAYLTFTSDGANGPTHSLTLSGTGRVLPPASCKTLLASAPTTPSGYYTLQPDRTGAAPTLSAYCDMTTDGGGWTRVNASVVQTSSLPFGSNDKVSGKGVGSTSCSTVNSNWTVTKPAVTYDKIRLEFTRSTTVLQCSSVYSGSAILSDMAQGAFWSGSAWVTNNTCVWGDGVWANSGIDATGLPTTWRLQANRSADGTIKLATLCGYATDTGTFTATMWLR